MLLSWSCSCWQESIARDRERLHQLVRDAEEQAKLKSTSVAGPPRDLEAWISSQAQQLQEQLEQVRKTAELEKNEDAEANAELRRQLDKLEALDGEADRTSVSKAGAPGDKNVVPLFPPCCQGDNFLSPNGQGDKVFVSLRSG